MQDQTSKKKVFPWILLALGTYSILSLFSMATMSFGLGVLFIVTAWLFLRKYISFSDFIHPFFRDSPQLILFFYSALMLMGVCLLSLVMAKLNPLEFAGKSPPVDLFKDGLKLWYLLLPFWLLFLWLQLPELKRRQILIGWILTAGCLGIIAFVQFYTGFPRPLSLPNFVDRYHASLFFGHHLSTASILIFPFFVGLSLSVSKAQDAYPSKKRGLILCFSSWMGLALLLTWSRTLWVGLPLGLGLWSLRRLRTKQMISLSVLVLMISFGVLNLPFARERMISRQGVDDRIELWKANWQFFKEKPIFGIGFRKSQSLIGSYFEEKYPSDWTRRFAGHAHNNVLEMLSGVGIVGTLLWVYWNYLVFKMAIRSSRHPDFWGDVSWGVFCSWWLLHWNGLTQVNFWEGKVLHQMMWAISLVLICVVSREQQKNKNPMDQSRRGIP